MAITDTKEIPVSGRTVLVRAEKTALRSYTFFGKLGDHEARLNVFIEENGDLQAHVNTARQAIAMQAVSEVEHLEREAQID